MQKYCFDNLMSNNLLSYSTKLQAFFDKVKRIRKKTLEKWNFSSITPKSALAR